MEPDIKVSKMRAIFFLMVLLTFCGLPNTGSARAEEEAGADAIVDLAFVVDNSGSMKKNDPDYLTSRVVRSFISRLPKQTRVSIVLFDGSARLVTPLTSLSDSRSGEAISAGLDRIDYRGQHTNIPIGIERAVYELRIHGRPKAFKGVIFITDGIVDTGDRRKDEELTQWLKEDLTQQSRSLDIRIFAIALTDAADFSLIQMLAARTDGEYFRAYNISEISAVFDRIQAIFTPPPLLIQAVVPPSIAPLEVLLKTSAATMSPPAGNETVAIPAKTPVTSDNTVVVIEKGTWLAAIMVIVVVFLIVAMCVFFFFFHQDRKRRAATSLSEEKALNIPRAHLEDMDGICRIEEGTLILDKEHINIGRGKRNDIILDRLAISGFHATIEFRNMSFYLEDQRSTNGTMLNDRRLPSNESVRLKSGDRITFAKYNFQFIVNDEKPFGDTVMLSMTALTDPDAESTMVLDLDGDDSKQGLISCMQSHLMQIYGLGPKYKDFINSYFSHEILDLLATTAHENLQRTKQDQEQYCTPIIKNKTFYLACSLPVSITSAAEWFGLRDQGFTQYVLQWVKSSQYQAAHCEQLCIFTFGQDPATWVSVTVMPTHSDPDPVEIMSVDFLNEEEKASLALDFDNHGRVI
jgi:pSer/pThr/pTyr-binding forkhead associated (FHA) protein/Mg-chelatase subunit ChlD